MLFVSALLKTWNASPRIYISVYERKVMMNAYNTFRVFLMFFWKAIISSLKVIYYEDRQGSLTSICSWEQGTYLPTDPVSSGYTWFFNPPPDYFLWPGGSSFSPVCCRTIRKTRDFRLWFINYVAHWTSSFELKLSLDLHKQCRWLLHLSNC